jgi:hypothetical protein
MRMWLVVILSVCLISFWLGAAKSANVQACAPNSCSDQSGHGEQFGNQTNSKCRILGTTGICATVTCKASVTSNGVTRKCVDGQTVQDTTQCRLFGGSVGGCGCDQEQ